MKFADLELAFDFVSSGRPFEHTAYVRRSTGETFWRSDLADEDELPEGFEEDEDFVEIPHPNFLELGQALVWSFVGQTIPDHYDEVQDIFSARGAYGRFKALLDRLGKLDQWHVFEEARTQEALLDWCRENDLEVET